MGQCDCPHCHKIRSLAADLARVTAERDDLDFAIALCEKDRDDARDKCAVLLADALRLERERDAALAEVEAMRAALKAAHGALCDIADSEDEHGVPSTREWMQKRAEGVVVTTANALRSRKVGG